MTEPPLGVQGGAAPSAFTFEAAGLESNRLAELVSARDFPLDRVTVADRILLASPLEIGATPYVGVRAIYRPRDELPLVEAPAARSVEEARVLLRRTMELGVAHALRGVRRAAVLTGGGLDSGALLALAHDWAKKHDASVFGTAMDFGGEGDDRPYLAALERHLGCEVVRSTPADAARRIELLWSGADAAPLTWPSAAMDIEALARAKAHGAEVVLAGIGADEIFDGEPTALAGLARRHPLVAVTSARAMRGFDKPAWPTFSWILRPSIASALPPFVRRWRRRRGGAESTPWAGPALRRAVERHAEARRRTTVPRQGPWDKPHYEHIAWLRHQEDMCAGIECRTIFLERSLRAVVERFPSDWLLCGSIRRGLFREAVRDLLPRALVERTSKAYFEHGLATWLSAAGGFDRLRPLASGERLAELELVTPAKFRETFEQFERAPENDQLWTRLWPALAVEAFLRGRP